MLHIRIYTSGDDGTYRLDKTLQYYVVADMDSVHEHHVLAVKLLDAAEGSVEGLGKLIKTENNGRINLHYFLDNDFIQAHIPEDERNW